MFAYIATHFFPSWLGYWMIAATVISSFGPFNSVTAPLARSVWAMAVGRDGGLGEHRYLPYFMSWSFKYTFFLFLFSFFASFSIENFFA